MTVAGKIYLCSLPPSRVRAIHEHGIHMSKAIRRHDNKNMAQAYPETTETTFGLFSLSEDSRRAGAAPPYAYESPSSPNVKLARHRPREARIHITSTHSILHITSTPPHTTYYVKPTLGFNLITLIT
jgi:hypothetical protein